LYAWLFHISLALADMNAPLKSPPYNPRMLRWAREWRGRSIEEAAAKIGKSAETVAQWERSDGAPTVSQARKLADYYERPFLEFFLSEPPEIQAPKAIPDFRTHVGAVVPERSREFQEVLQWCEAQRVNALDLYEQLGEQPLAIPEGLFSTLNTPPSRVADVARQALSFSFKEQVAASQRDALGNEIRARLERVGILTLRLTSLKQFRVRGICIADLPLPTIAYSNEAPVAQAFTLLHEFGHILVHESGITGFRYSDYESHPIERWCDRFAASFLMPDAEVALQLGGVPPTPAADFADPELEQLARTFGVSSHAMLIRLVHLGYVAASYYWDVKKPVFDTEEAKYKRFGRTKYYGARYKASLGDLYTGLVVAAWTSGRITNHNAAEYMGIKNLAHLNDIRRAVLGT
jgi:Zn-dependent peptidase ImmA (M78 family)/transcriptional regulator with XRE-family HTH domain